MRITIKPSQPLNYFARMMVPNVARALYIESGINTCPKEAVYDQAIEYFEPLGLVVEEDVKGLREDQEDGVRGYTIEECSAAFDFLTDNEARIWEGALRLQAFEAQDDLDGVDDDHRVTWSAKNILWLIGLSALLTHSTP